MAKTKTKMGKRNGGKKFRWRNGKKPKENVWRTMEECPRESELFENYYKLQKIVPDGEWDQFIETLVLMLIRCLFVEKRSSYDFSYQRSRPQF